MASRTMFLARSVMAEMGSGSSSVKTDGWVHLGSCRRFAALVREVCTSSKSCFARRKFIASSKTFSPAPGSRQSPIRNRAFRSLSTVVLLTRFLSLFFILYVFVHVFLQLVHST